MLKKQVGAFTAISIVVGIVIGSGVFVKPGKVLLQTGSSSMALLAWLAGGIMSICAGLTVAEIGVRIPKTGGVYAYVEEIYGKTMGFLCGWVLTFLYSPALKGALSLYFATLAQPLFGFSTETIKAFAIATVLFLASLNIISTRVSGYLSGVTTIAKLVPIFLIIIFGLSSGQETIFKAIEVDPVGVSFGAAVLSTLWAYDGWILVANMSGEMKNPATHLPFAIITGLLIVIVAYLGVNMALFHTLPVEKIAELGPNAASAVAEVLFAGWGGKLISIGILISIFGCLNGDMLSGPRVPFAMASSGNLKGCSKISRVHPKFGTPANAVLLQVAVALLMILAASPDQITDFAIFSVYIFFTLSFFGLFILRKRNYGSNQGKYRVPLYPIVPIIAIVASLYILGSTVLAQPTMALTSVGITLLGLPVYYLFLKKD